MFVDAKLVHFFDQCKEDKQDLVLVSVVDTKGDTFRKSGAKMLISQSGAFEGVVSGGCFEYDTIQCAKEAIETRTGKWIKYDLRVQESDEEWGMGLGCNGVIWLWVEPFYFESNYGILGTVMQSNSGDVLVRQMDAVESFAFVGQSTVVNNQTTLSNDELMLLAQTLMGNNALVEQNSNKYYVEKIQCPRKMLIMGAGPGASSLIAIAREVGFIVHLCEHRGKYAQFGVNADKQVSFDSIRESYEAIVIMSHSFEYDYKYLQFALGVGSSYVGLMGPKKRRERLLECIKGSNRNIANLYNPIGLNLGGESPSEIALSICSEVLVVLNAREPLHLRDKRK